MLISARAQAVLRGTDYFDGGGCTDLAGKQPEAGCNQSTDRRRVQDPAHSQIHLPVEHVSLILVTLNVPDLPTQAPSFAGSSVPTTSSFAPTNI
jgi:hypothetical protein